MCHGDDQGLVLPPRVAPLQVVIIPVVVAKKVRTVGALRRIAPWGMMRKPYISCTALTSTVEIVRPEAR